MRGFDCPTDEHHHHGQDDEELFQQVRKHANQDHPGQFSDDQVRGFIRDGGYEDVQHAEAGATRA